MSNIRAVPKFPEENFEHIVIPRVEGGVGMYSMEILKRGMSIGISVNLDNLNVEYDRFGNVVDVTGVETNIDEPTLQDWHPVVHDFGDLDLATQAEVAKGKNKLKAVLRSLPDVQVVLVNRYEHEGLYNERPEVRAFRNTQDYGTLVGSQGRVLFSLVDKLAAEGKVFEATAGHVIVTKQGTYHDGRPVTTYQVEGRLFMPPADRILKWYSADDEARQKMDLSKPATAIFSLKESGKYSENISALLGEATTWTGTAEVESIPLSKGKYAGQAKLDFFVDGKQVGSNHPQYREREQLLFDYVSNGHSKVPVRLSSYYLGYNEKRLEVCFDLDEI